MIELIHGLPEGVVGIEAVGTVTSADYQAVTPVIDEALAAHGKIRLIHILGDRFDDFTAGGVWEDGKFGLSNALSFERIAVVTDRDSVRRLVKAAGWAAPGEMRLFANAERDQALAWTSADLPSAR